MAPGRAFALSSALLCAIACAADPGDGPKSDSAWLRPTATDENDLLEAKLSSDLIEAARRSQRNGRI